MKKLFYLMAVAIIAATGLLTSCTEEEVVVKSDGSGSTEQSPKQW